MCELYLHTHLFESTVTRVSAHINYNVIRTTRTRPPLSCHVVGCNRGLGRSPSRSLLSHITDGTRHMVIFQVPHPSTSGGVTSQPWQPQAAYDGAGGGDVVIIAARRRVGHSDEQVLSSATEGYLLNDPSSHDDEGFRGSERVGRDLLVFFSRQRDNARSGQQSDRDSVGRRLDANVFSFGEVDLRVWRALSSRE